MVLSGLNGVGGQLEAEWSMCAMSVCQGHVASEVAVSRGP